MKNLRVLLVFVLASGVAATSGAATFSVTSSADSGAGSLRAAITSAEANAEADVITFAGDMTIVLASPLPDITTDITIQGHGWQHTIIDGGNPPGGTSGAQPFNITSTGSLVLDGVHMQNCYGTFGGAVYSEGSFLFRNSYADSNRAGYGGFLATDGPTAIEGSVVVGNSVTDWGGAILGWSNSRIALTNAAIAENTGASLGGGVAIQGGVLLAQGTLFEGNEAGVAGGGLYLMGHARIANSTFTHNTAPAGAAAYVFSAIPSAILTQCTVAVNYGPTLDGGTGQLYLRDTIVAYNQATNCSGVVSAGGNIEDFNTCGGSAILGDLVNTDPQLGGYTLFDRGGLDFTYYYPIAATSPAIDSATSCSWDDDANAGTPQVPLTVDQRRFARPYDGDHNGSAICDRGAIEYYGLLFLDGFESGDTSYWSATVPGPP